MLEIYLTDLQAYNEGHLVGKWLKLPLTPFELSQALSEVLTEGEIFSGTDNHEEYFITDYSWDEHEFFEVGEYDNLQELNQKIEQLQEMDASLYRAIAFLMCENIATDMDDAIAKAENVTIHENQTMEDIAYEVAQELYGVDSLPSIIANHIDYEGIGREFEMDGNYFEVGSDIYEYVG